MFTEIKTIPIQTVLDKVGVKYKKTGTTLSLLDGGKQTDGWKASLSNNIVTSFSKDRPQGNPYDFVMKYMGYDKKQTIDFFRQNFGIKEKEYKPYTARELSQVEGKKAIEYIKSRNIDYEKIKNLIRIGKHNVYQGIQVSGEAIQIFMKDLITEDVVGDQKRMVESKIFDSTGNDGFFFDGIKGSQWIMITEGMFDYLSIRQHTTNVLGMKRNDREWTEQEIEYLNSFQQVIVLLDNDESGRKGLEKIKKLLDTNLYTIDFNGYKDINDITMQEGDVMNYIRDRKIELSKKAFEHINYKTKMELAKEELLATNPAQIVKWGWKEWDDYLGGIYGGKIYVIGGESGNGKSTFINTVCENIQEQGHRVVKYSLEDRMADKGKEDMFYWINRKRYAMGLDPYIWTHFVNGEYGENGEYADSDYLKFIDLAVEHFSKSSIIELEKERQVTIQDLVRLMEEEAKRGARFFAIDHLHYFQMKNTERTDLEIQNIMHQINEVARKYNVAVFLVAHYKKLGNESPTNDSFKDASAIKQVANIIIHIERKYEPNFSDETIFRIGKIRGPIKPQELKATFDITTFTYNFTKYDTRERKNISVS